MSLDVGFEKTALDVRSAEKRGNLDYVAIQLTPRCAKSDCYTDLVSSNDESANAFLASLREFKFLVDDNLIIFSTEKTAADLACSYEYKLRYIPETAPQYEKLICNWDKREERAAITYFTQERKVNGFENRGIWFIGVERPLFANGNRLKIFFKTFFENDVGDRLYTDDEYMDIVAACGIDAFKELVQTGRQYLSRSFHLYMAAWNYEPFSGESKYKLYFICDGKTEAVFFDSIYNTFQTTPHDIDQINELIHTADFSFAGFSLCLDTKQQKSVKLYYRRERRRI